MRRDKQTKIDTTVPDDSPAAKIRNGNVQNRPEDEQRPTFSEDEPIPGGYQYPGWRRDVRPANRKD